jgi:isocitrate/isopropylmalate dehydrogenase
VFVRGGRKRRGWGRPEQGILKLRKEMGTFGNLRPCNFAAPSLVESSPLKAHFLAQLEDTLFWAHGAGAPFLLVRMGQ